MTKDALILFGIAFAVRAVLAVVQALYGVHGLPGLQLSTWNDFYVVYGQWLGYLHNGLLPYRDFYTYKYTPLFIYTLYAFFVAAGEKAASIPIIVSDAATAVLVYLIAKRFSGNRIALAAGLVYTFAPFVLYYEDYLWLSSQPMTFFIVLAVYLFRVSKPVLSFASLAVAVMFKQQALFIMPAYLLLYVRDYKACLPRGIAAFVAIVVVVSLPFLIAAPTDYVGSLNYFTVYLGPPEQAQPIAASIVNNATLAPNPLGTCGLQTIPGVYTGTICGSIANVKEFSASLLAGRVNQIAAFLEPLLLALLIPALYASRRSRIFPQMLCIYSLLASLVFFSDFVEPSLGYYFVPVYALIFASITDKRTLLAGVATAFLSAFITEGPFEVILPLGCLFVLIALQDTSMSHLNGSSTTLT